MCKLKRERPTVEFRSKGESGNIYYILKLVSMELLPKGRRRAFEKIKRGVMSSPSYSDALSIIRTEVNLIDLDGDY